MSFMIMAVLRLVIEMMWVVCMMMMFTSLHEVEHDIVCEDDGTIDHDDDDACYVHEVEDGLLLMRMCIMMLTLVLLLMMMMMMAVMIIYMVNAF